MIFTVHALHHEKVCVAVRAAIDALRQEKLNDNVVCCTLYVDKTFIFFVYFDNISKNPITYISLIILFSGKIHAACS